MLHRAARNAYSWWWASHIRTKQSKWLDQNLQDMEEKVEYILKIIGEDADTFAQRAEMYYQKRLELMNFVEDSFRGYRALSERYDHLSRELQSANRTIATIYPERIYLGMDDDDNIGDLNIPPKAPPEFGNGSKGIVPAAPNLNIQKLTSFGKKNSKMPSRLMSKKGLIKINQCAASTPSSGMSKVEALEEIDKLQKEILGLQTEREFVKSSYECGLAKYWDIENQVTEKQARVNSLQDELGVGTFIEDDEARTLMTNSALKSCQEALARLQTTRQHWNQLAREEHLKIQQAQERIEMFKKRIYGNESIGKETSEKDEKKNVEVEVEVDSIDLDKLRKKIKDDLGFDSQVPLAMPELADKVDELVEKIINLETALCSQTAKVKGLMSYTNELQSHLQSLEEDKEYVPEDSNKLSHKIREIEEKLSGVQRLDQNIQTSNDELQTNFLEASFQIDQLSEKLLDVKPYHEGANMNLIEEKEDITFDSWYSGYSEKGARLQTIISTVMEDKENIAIHIKDDEVMCDVSVKEKEKLDDVLNGDVTVKEREKSNDVLNQISSGSSKNDIKESESSDQYNPINEFKERDDTVPSDGKVSFFVHTNPMYSSNSKETTAPTDNQVGEDLNTINEQKHEVSDNLSIILNNMEMEREPKNNLLLDQGENQKIENQDSFKTANSDRNSFKTAVSDRDSFKTTNNEFILEQEKLSTEYDGEPNWKELCLSGLDDKEKILLQEYTKILRNYKDVKKKLNEVEKKRRASLFQTAVQIKVLTRANSSKTTEIQSLQDKLNRQILELKGLKPEQSIIVEEENEDDKISIHDEEDISIHTDDPQPFTSLEGKIRMEIDDLLEENIECWLRFSTSFHQIQKFQTSVEDLQAEAAKVKEKKQELPPTKYHMILSEIRPIYRHLREIQTELTLLLENNGVLKDDLNNRLSSLSNLHEEITILSKTELSEYQAAKFQGEIMNMKQENSKVTNELQLGFVRVRELQSEIQKTLSELDDELGISGNQQRSRSKIPLRSFLFGVKLKKQKPSLFSCINPALQKQYSDLEASQR